MVKVAGDIGLAEFQEENCTGCFFSDKELVGTGKACCTRSGGPKVVPESRTKHGRCTTKEFGEPQNAPPLPLQGHSE